MRAYNLGLIGLGKFGKRYVETIREHFPQINLAISCRKTNERPEFLPDTTQFTTDWKEVASGSNLDGIIVCLDPEMNGKVIANLSKEIPLLVEKPFALSSQQFHGFELLQRAPILVNYSHLFSEVFQKMVELIGYKEIIAINSTGYNDGPIRSFPALFDYGAHDLSMGLFFGGNNKAKLEYQQKRFEAASPEKALYQLIVSYGDIKHTMEFGNDGDEKRRTIDVFLPDGELIEIDGDTLSHFKTNDYEPDAIYRFGPNKSLIGTLNYFLRLIDGKDDNRVDMMMTEQMTRILEEVYEGVG